MIYAIFLFLMCGIGATIVASNKGRSAFGWFLLGFLLGPIGFILSLIVAKNSSVIEDDAIRSGVMRKCPFCAELVKVEANICKHCQKDLPEFKPEPARQVSLHDAAKNGHWTTVSRLLKEGADVNQTDAEGKTALDIARARRNHMMIRVLREHAAKNMGSN